MFEGERLERCPIKLITRATLDCIRLYRYFEKGHLPCAGGIQNQPAKLLDFFETIDGVINEIADEQERILNASSNPRQIRDTPKFPR